jgi:hypothetical protein
MRVAIEERCTAARIRLATAVALFTMLVLVGAAPSFADPRWSEEQREPGLSHPGGYGGLLLPGGLWLAGDVTVNGTVPEHGRASAELDDVSLLLRYEPHPRLSFFTEARLDDALEYIDGEGLQETSGGDLSIERLYADWLVTPRFTLRVGKFLTPFGLWNVVRRAPLTWTVERPAVTEEEVIPQHGTGLSLIYQTTWHGWSLDATGYGPAQDELAFRRTPNSGLLFGGRTAAGHSLGPAFVAVGLDGAEFAPHRGSPWTHLYGLDLEASFRDHHLTAEFNYSWLPAPLRRQQGVYVQDVFPLTGTLYGVLRFDHFQPPRGRAGTGALVGVFWQPIRFVIVKADYQFADRELEDLVPGFVASVSFLF